MRYHSKVFQQWGGSMEESAFKTKVDLCRKRELPDLIHNSARQHAKYLIEQLLDVAAEKHEDVRLISGELRDDFYGDLVSLFEAVKSKGANVEILVLNNIPVEKNSLASWAKKQNALFRPRDCREPITAPHMLLVGERGHRFRLETDHAQAKAVASFNNPFMGEMLLSIYDQAKAQAALAA